MLPAACAFCAGCFFNAESCKKSPTRAELGCLADCGGGENRLSLLLTHRKLQKKRPRGQNLGVLRTAAEVRAGSARFLALQNC